MTFYATMNLLELGLIAILSAILAFAFYKSQNGWLRILMIWFFATNTWVYAGAAILYNIFKPESFIWVRLFLITPEAVIMILLWRYIRKLPHNRLK